MLPPCFIWDSSGVGIEDLEVQSMIGDPEEGILPMIGEMLWELEPLYNVYSYFGH